MIVFARNPRVILKERRLAASAARNRATAALFQERDAQKALDLAADPVATEAWKAWMATKLKETV